MLITSMQNEKIKKILKLKETKYRKLENKFLIEGEHLVEEAYKSNLVDALIIEENYSYEKDANTIYVTNEIMKKLSDMPSPSKVMAVCNMKKDVLKGNKILILDGVQDPGNLGTIIRSAIAFNVDTIILSNDTVDLYNPKVVRATQGMIFHINIIVKDLKEEISNLKNQGIKVLGTKVDRGKDTRFLNSNLKNNYCLIMGNEGNGVKKELLDECDDYLYIKMNEAVESLNVGVATSIILYELNR